MRRSSGKVRRLPDKSVRGVFYIAIAIGITMALSIVLREAAALLAWIGHEADVLFFALNLYQWILLAAFFVREDECRRTGFTTANVWNKRFLLWILIPWGSAFFLLLKEMRPMSFVRGAAILTGICAATVFPFAVARVVRFFEPNGRRRSAWLIGWFAAICGLQLFFSGWAAARFDTHLLLRLSNDPALLIRGIGTVFLPARWTALTWLSAQSLGLPFWLNAGCLLVCGILVRKTGIERISSYHIEEADCGRSKYLFRRIALPWLMPVLLGCALFWLAPVLRMLRFLAPYGWHGVEWIRPIAAVSGFWLGWGSFLVRIADPDRANNSGPKREIVETFSLLSVTIAIGMLVSLPAEALAYAAIGIGVISWPLPSSEKTDRVYARFGMFATFVLSLVLVRFVGTRIQEPTTILVLTWASILGFCGLRLWCVRNMKKDKGR